MKRYLFLILATLSCFILFFYLVNFYFLSRLSSSSEAAQHQTLKSSHYEFNDGSHFPGDFNPTLLHSKYKIKNPKLELVKSKIIKTFSKSCAFDGHSFSSIWSEVNSWAQDNRFIYPQYDSFICKVIRALQTVPFVSASNARKGTQLKLHLQVEGNQSVYFKPSWYSRNRIIEGPVYSGKDRHNSEILAFYLGAILNLRLTPIAVGRTVNFKEIWKLGDKELRETMFITKNDSRICLYGKCFYCKASEAICADKMHQLEGVLLYEVPGKMLKHKSPWQRSYKDNVKAIWQQEGNEHYCELVKTKLQSSRLLDLIDASIFDFLIQNGDRHHYETRNERVVLIDNGKGFGNPHVDFIDILAPLYQCCILRQVTFERLSIFTGGELSETLKTLTSNDLLNPVITEHHYAALERRLLKIFSVIEFCRAKNGDEMFQ